MPEIVSKLGTKIVQNHLFSSRSLQYLSMQIRMRPSQPQQHRPTNSLLRVRTTLEEQPPLLQKLCQHPTHPLSIPLVVHNSPLGNRNHRPQRNHSPPYLPRRRRRRLQQSLQQTKTPIRHMPRQRRHETPQGQTLHHCRRNR